MTQNRSKTSVLGSFTGAHGRSVDSDQVSPSPSFSSMKYIPLYLTIPLSLLNAIKFQIFLKIKNQKTTPSICTSFPTIFYKE